MSSTLETLIYMANQIARNLELRRDPAAAVADHIATFWDSRMKAAIGAHAETSGKGLSRITTDAMHILRKGDAPAHQTDATEFNAVGEVGHSDAG